MLDASNHKEMQVWKVLHKEMQGWKVLSEKNGRYYSVMKPRLLEYVPGQWTRPLKSYGPLSLFDLRSNAVRFREYMSVFCFLGDLTVRQCVYVESPETELYRYEESFQTVGFVTLPYEGRRASLPLDMCPRGTILATDIKICLTLNGE